MKQTIRLVVAHRNRLFRECLANALSSGDRFAAYPIDYSAVHLPDGAHQQHAEVVLVDVNLPGEAVALLIGQLSQRMPATRIILLSSGQDEEEIAHCFAAGAHGCVLEQSSLQDLRIAIEKAIRGETFCSPEIVHSMFHRLAQTAHHAVHPSRPRSVALTPRELEVIQLIAARLSNKQIAKRLSLSLYTVKNHVHNIVEKLQVEDRFEAVEYARHRRWLKPPVAAEPSRQHR